MKRQNRILKAEDYEEPRCLLSGDPYGVTPEVIPVPIQRILRRMDEYMGRKDYEEAERHLLYWLEEAGLGHDRKGQLLICNELVGYYRKMADKEKAYRYGKEAESLLSALSMTESLSGGTTYVNIATACSAFGDNALAMTFFEKARAIYESSEYTRPDLLGGLYNNMGLACAALGRFSEASQFYGQAMEQMDQVTNGALEQAITCLNQANLVEAELGLEQGDSKICALLEEARGFLDRSDLPRDGYYAFVCEKCAPTFDYYGYFLYSKELLDRAEEIIRQSKSE